MKAAVTIRARRRRRGLRSGPGRPCLATVLLAAGALFTAGLPGLPDIAAAQSGTMAVATPPQGENGCDPGETQIRFSHVVVETGHPKGEAATALATAVNAGLNGQACMIVYPDSTLFDDNTVLEAMLRGEVEMAAPSLSKFDRYTKVFRVFDLPFLFKDSSAVEWFQNSGPGSRLKRSIRPLGFRALAFWNNGLKQMSTRRPIGDPEDIRGLTFRIQESEVIRAQFQMLGAKPIPMAFKNVATALETGKVDGQENSWSNILSKNFYRWQDGVTETNHGVLGYALVTSETFWKSLPQVTRARLAGIVAKVSAEANQKAQKLDQTAKRELETRGVVIRQLSAQQRAAWVAAMAPVWRRFEGEIGASYIEAAQSANR